ncbi:uncharacterized protein L969DRAFT_16397 [Mixia osmundae IAM 14324]|uniref:ATP-dependent RNA helicase n=1 Tax=Mixia osmundae (strain CBS 9802 / IAM 14324 / JCM 22182 / KY 12970) TaxID=764103 RepID=G7DUB3_MIXOS|nr:uncharacterized protein L969DRAFT_16397 [Mixia osmundae IAM 14324]KEI41045.1 hypothetical protein L969DRAFT_16397 [Mixia osmundae IAM 14324]GAA94173.1 hypothetical protein E5Q_00821 [Mixia osmundae IAM 14324]
MDGQQSNSKRKRSGYRGKNPRGGKQPSLASRLSDPRPDIDESPDSSYPASVAGDTNDGAHGSSRQTVKKEDTLAHLTDMRFSAFANLLTPSLFKAIPHEFCTEVQAQTLPVALKGKDILARALTGTGKTLGFLIPSLDRLLRNPTRPGQVGILVMSPTRELATQTADAAKQLLSSSPSLGVQLALGGGNVNAELKRLTSQRVDVLVATPGRLIDHLANNGLAPRLNELQTFVLDEADQLLQQGFKQDIDRIVSFLPDRRTVPRQTLLFSATVSPQIQQVAKLTLLPDHDFISTIKESDLNTHERVKQTIIEVPFERIFAATLAVILREIQQSSDDCKLLLFFPTARATGVAKELFDQIELPLPRWEVHSRKSQSAREKATEAFKAARKGILFSSDVSARGMDFPDVTAVIQVGLPASTEQYIHRLGRTARAGKEGRGILILAPYERPFLSLSGIKQLPIKPDPTFTTALYEPYQPTIEQALSRVSNESKGQAYSAYLGFTKGFVKLLQTSAKGVVDLAEQYAVNVLLYVPEPGQPRTPPLMASTIGKMGLRELRPYLNVVKELPPKQGANGQAVQARGHPSPGRGGRGGSRGGHRRA